MNSLHPRLVLEVLADSRGEAAGDTERRGESGPVEVLEPTGGERCAERAAHRRRVPAACVKLPRRRHADPGHRLVTGDRRRHDRPAAVPAGFAERQHRGQDHRRGVGDRDGVRVVEVEPVRESAVGERRQGRGRRQTRADDAAGTAPPGPHRAEDGWRQVGGRRRERNPGPALARARALDADHAIVVDVRVWRGVHVLCQDTRRRFQATATRWDQSAEVVRASDGAVRYRITPGSMTPVFDLEADCGNPRDSRRTTTTRAFAESVKRLVTRPLAS